MIPTHEAETYTVYDLEVPSTDEKHILKGRVYVPDIRIRGLFQVVHGMVEHIGRYDSFMRELAAQGYLAFGCDQLGHGRTADEEGDFGYIAPKHGWLYMVYDVIRVADTVREQYGRDLPYTLMGHSMGSFIARLAAVRRRPGRLVIMGTGGPNSAAKAGILLADMVNRMQDGRKDSELLAKITFGKYSERFRGEGDPKYWLSKEPKTIHDNRSDPYCGFHFSASAMRDLIILSERANAKSWFDAVSTEQDGEKLPILLLSGMDDPVGDYSRGVRKICDMLQERGADVQMRLYADCRHEILNDTCRKNVIQEILFFIGDQENRR